jgi:hypothetical protein
VKVSSFFVLVYMILRFLCNSTPFHRQYCWEVDRGRLEQLSATLTSAQTYLTRNRSSFPAPFIYQQKAKQTLLSPNWISRVCLNPLHSRLRRTKGKRGWGRSIGRKAASQNLPLGAHDLLGVAPAAAYPESISHEMCAVCTACCTGTANFAAI